MSHRQKSEKSTYDMNIHMRMYFLLSLIVSVAPNCYNMKTEEEKILNYIIT